MAWRVENRRTVAVDEAAGPYLTEEIKAVLRERYFPRYPTKRAVLLPALHMIQHEHNWIPTKAIQEVAEFLEIAPAEALDTATFYEEYWLRPKGKYLIQVCRSLSCEICGSRKITQRIQEMLGIEIGETTADGKFTVVELECLGACDLAPVALVNEVLYENLTTESIGELIAKLPEDPHEHRDPNLTWEASH